EHRLLAVGLHRDYACNTPRVVNFAPNLIARDDLADRDHALRRGDERVIWLTRTALRLGLEADVEPDRGVEGGHLVDEDRLELGFEGVGVLVGGEVAARAAPAADGLDDAGDHVL